MAHTASPRSISPQSFQWPKRSRRLMYSSAKLTPPVKPTLPSIIMSFLWSRLLSRPESTGTKGLKTLAWMPSFPKYLSYPEGRVVMQPKSS